MRVGFLDFFFLRAGAAYFDLAFESRFFNSLTGDAWAFAALAYACSASRLEKVLVNCWVGFLLITGVRIEPASLNELIEACFCMRGMKLLTIESDRRI